MFKDTDAQVVWPYTCFMIYFDRRLPRAMLELLGLEGPASWLVPLIRSGLDPSARPHVQFRRNQGNRTHGSIQVYFGRTSPLELRGVARNRLGFFGDEDYVALSPELFKMTVTGEELPALRPLIEDQLRRACGMVNQTFVRGEATCHAGMLRRYGLEFMAGDPFVVVDSEVRAGFDSMIEQATFEQQQRSLLDFSSGDFPRKLDAAVVLASGELGIVELKAAGEDLRRAALQAAVHVGVFRELKAQRSSSYLGEVVNGLLEQKACVGLLGDGQFPRLVDDAPVVPIIAVPDDRDGWADSWRKEVSPVVKTAGPSLAGLRLWRLSPEGQLAEEAIF